MPLGKNVRHRFKQIDSNTRVRLVFKGNKVIAITPFEKKNGVYVKGHERRIR